MIVYVSDAGFHAQGDGKLSGLYRRYDESCHMVLGFEKEGDYYDYPSMGQE